MNVSSITYEEDDPSVSDPSTLLSDANEQFISDSSMGSESRGPNSVGYMNRVRIHRGVR